MRTSRLYPPAGGPCIHLLVFPDKDELVEWVEGIDGDREWMDQLDAICVTDPTSRISIGLNEDRLDLGTISHECLHAALSRARIENWLEGVVKDRGNWASPAEERLAVLQESLVVQVVRRLKKWGLWKP